MGKPQDFKLAKCMARMKESTLVSPTTILERRSRLLVWSLTVSFACYLDNKLCADERELLLACLCDEFNEARKNYTSFFWNSYSFCKNARW